MPIGKGEGLFRPARDDAEPFTIVMPPPNVTGSLHIGHALDNHAAGHPRPPRADAGQGRAVGGRHRPCRHRHADGGRAQPRQPAGSSAPTSAARPSSTMCGSGRRQSAAQITRQLRRLGASCDWANERFTMDEGFSKAVTKVFVELHKRGLLYRDKRLVNWDPKFQTAISDLEVETRDVQGKFWTLRYPLADGSGAHRGRDHAARDDARRHGGRGPSRRRALHGAGRQDRSSMPITGRADPDRHRRACRSRTWLGRGQDHAGPRLQRL